MQEAIKSGTGHDGIAGKDVSPFREGFVGGDNDGGIFLISVADDLEEQGSSGGIQAEVADFIDDEQLGLSKHFHGMREPILGEGSSQTAGQLHGAEEEETVAEFGRQDSKGDGEMGLADSWRAQKDDVSAIGQEASGGQFFDEDFVDGGLEGEVKILDALKVGQSGKAQVCLDDATAALCEFRLQETAQEVAVAPGFSGGLLGDVVEFGESGGGAELFESVRGEFFVGQAH